MSILQKAQNCESCAGVCGAISINLDNAEYKEQLCYEYSFQ